jgi:hypothetical protein
MKTKYQVVVGNIGTMDYTSEKLANDCFVTYVTMSKQNITSAAGESVTLFKNGEIIKEHIGTIENI